MLRANEPSASSEVLKPSVGSKRDCRTNSLKKLADVLTLCCKISGLSIVRRNQQAAPVWALYLPYTAQLDSIAKHGLRRG